MCYTHPTKSMKILWVTLLGNELRLAQALKRVQAFPVFKVLICTPRTLLNGFRKSTNKIDYHSNRYSSLHYLIKSCFLTKHYHLVTRVKGKLLGVVTSFIDSHCEKRSSKYIIKFIKFINQYFTTFINAKMILHVKL